MSVPDCIRSCSSCAEMLGVPLSCSTNSPNALLGTLTPENSSYPAASQAVDAAVEDGNVRVAPLRQHLGRALGKALVRIDQHDARRLARHQPRHAQLQPAQRHRAREQQMTFGENRSSRTSSSASSAPSTSIARSAAAPVLRTPSVIQVACCGVI